MKVFACTGLVICLMVACQEKQQEHRSVVATVDGAPLYLDALERELRRNRFDGEEGAQPSLESLRVQTRTLLDNLIDRRLLLREAERYHVVVGTDEVEAAYERTRAGWSDTDIDELLHAKDVTPAELKRELRELSLIRKYLHDHVFARIAVTDAEISDYIKNHPELQIQPDEVHALQIVVQTEEKAEAILREIQRGMPFGEAAVKYSLSPEAKNGGDRGFFVRGSMPDVFDNVCFDLREGEVSNVVGSDFGFHLFKIVEKRSEGLRPIEKVRDQVERLLRHQKESDAHNSKLVELRAKAKIAIDEKELARVR